MIDTGIEREGEILIDLGEEKEQIVDLVLSEVRRVRNGQGLDTDAFIEGLVRSNVTGQKLEKQADGGSIVTAPIVDRIVDQVHRDSISPEETDAFREYVAKWSGK